MHEPCFGYLIGRYYICYKDERHNSHARGMAWIFIGRAIIITFVTKIKCILDMHEVWAFRINMHEALPCFGHL